MSLHFYAFGSICRGELDLGSDIDILVCTSKENADLDKEKFSIYTHQKLQKLWSEGNPFAWHLYLESKMIFSSTSTDFIRDLGAPNTYKLAKVDCIKFRDLFVESYKALIESTNSKVFNLSCMFLAARNFATCYSLSNQQPVFSRKSPFLIKEKLVLDENVFNILTRARLLSTRGYGDLVSHDEVHKVLKEATKIKEWMEYLIKVKCYE